MNFADRLVQSWWIGEILTRRDSQLYYFNTYMLLQVNYGLVFPIRPTSYIYIYINVHFHVYLQGYIVCNLIYLITFLEISNWFWITLCHTFQLFSFFRYIYIYIYFLMPCWFIFHNIFHFFIVYIIFIEKIFYPFVETKKGIKFSASYWSRNKKYFLFSFTASGTLL